MGGVGPAAAAAEDRYSGNDGLSFEGTGSIPVLDDDTDLASLLGKVHNQGPQPL